MRHERRKIKHAALGLNDTFAADFKYPFAGACEKDLVRNKTVFAPYSVFGLAYPYARQIERQPEFIADYRIHRIYHIAISFIRFYFITSAEIMQQPIDIGLCL